VLRRSSELVDQWCIFPIASDRSATAEELQVMLAELGAQRVTSFDDVAAATQAARCFAGDGGRVLVFGSFYTVGPAMAALGLYCVPTDCV
jgi:dihydrofolate synthase/folylpolyglutamate synthase